RTYLEWLNENSLHDPEARLELAGEAVKEAARESEFQLGGLWLDGFSELTPQELSLLAAVVPSCARVTLAFCLDAEPEQELGWDSKLEVDLRFGGVLGLTAGPDPEAEGWVAAEKLFNLARPGAAFRVLPLLVRPLPRFQRFFPLFLLGTAFASFWIGASRSLTI